MNELNILNVSYMLNKIKRFDNHSHSMFSNFRLLDSINRPRDMILKAYKLGLSGIALTDHETVSGHVEWLECEKELKEKGLISKDFKCACGNEIYLVDDRYNIERYWHYILIAKNTEGHKALRKLSSIAWYNGYKSKGMFRVPTQKNELENIVKEFPNTLIATTACLGGELPHLVLNLIEAESKECEEEIYEWKSKIDKFIRWNIDLFGDDFYIEIAAAMSKEQIRFNERVISIAKAYNRKIVIGSDAHYLTKKERPVHKAYLNSKNGEREVDDFYTYSHLMDNEEAFEYLSGSFSKEQFIEFCNNSMDIYNKIEGYNLFRKPIIPEVKVKNYSSLIVDEDFKSNYSTLSELFSSNNIQERYWVNECYNSMKNKKIDDEKHISRLETEAKVIKIIGEKLEDCLYKYFNTFQHFIDLFWENGSIVGPGRGSAVCFLSNYLLGITQLDPLMFNLPYWRFLNEERVELPDIDIDLTPSKRKLIFEAMRKERGELNVIQVCTYGTETTRSAISTACRGYRSEKYPDGIDIDSAKYLTSLIPQERGFLWPLQDAYYGNEEKNRKPIQTFINELEKYPGLFEIIESIEGIVCKRGQHASGVILYNDNPFETGALMRSPNGDLTTQYSLHEAEKMGDVKYDFLVTEICDKISAAIQLLQEDNLIDSNLSLREVYNNYLHPDKIDINDNDLWDALSSGNVLDVFQFSTGVGLATAKQIKPHSIDQMVSANALMRLMGEQDKERPIDRYCRLKQDMNIWYKECEDAGLTEEEVKNIEQYYLPNFGVPASQEDLMLVCLDKNIASFTLKEANAARKIVAKKKVNEVPDLRKKFISQCPSKNLGKYIWETVMEPQMSYSFAKPHALAYSYVGLQTLYLATKFPNIYWNCACLIINAGGAELLESDCSDEEDDTTKKENKSVNYGKISIALGKSKKDGIKVLPPDINKSGLIFKPDLNENAIFYGLKGIDRIGTNLVYEIISNRPYNSMEDFMNKVKINKTQMISLIKAGAFDKLCDFSREKIMNNYLEMITDKKKRITMQNMQMLINYNLIPDEFAYEQKLFNFNKYLKRFSEKGYYRLDNIAMAFFTKNYDDEVLERVTINGENQEGYISQSIWNNTYTKGMEKVKSWMKDNQQEILDELNKALVLENKNKYADGSVSKWEMDSLGFYYHEHELEKLKKYAYSISDFDSLPEEPQIERTFTTKEGTNINLYSISRIAGTVIDKDKNKGQIILLTTTGVVTVKIWKNQFAAWDKQISERDMDGNKHIIEKSWFTKGNKLIITGMRREDTFIPKKYKDTEWALIEKINEISDDGYIISSDTERIEEEVM